MKQRCYLCRKAIHYLDYDWGYMFEEDGVRWAHIACLEVEDFMSRVEATSYLLETFGDSALQPKST